MTRPHRRRRGAFTLMEVLLVLVILVVLSSISVAVFTGTRQRANIQAAHTQVTALKGDIERYWLHTNQYPQQLNDLLIEPQHLAGLAKWSGPYISKIPLDPWDRPFSYVTPSQRNSPDGFDLWSLGPDGVQSDDDIGNW